MMRSPLLSLLLLACTVSSSAPPPERYGFVATLGNDTVSVERVERSPTRLVTDGVDRWPFVRRRQTEVDLAKDGTIRRMVMDVRTPNGPSPRERGRRITADLGFGLWAMGYSGCLSGSGALFPPSQERRTRRPRLEPLFANSQ